MRSQTFDVEKNVIKETGCCQHKIGHSYSRGSIEAFKAMDQNAATLNKKKLQRDQLGFFKKGRVQL